MIAGQRKKRESDEDQHLADVLLALCLLSAHAEAEARYIHTDALDSVVAVTGENRNVLERREYEPYGKQLTRQWRTGRAITGMCRMRRPAPRGRRP